MILLFQFLRNARQRVRFSPFPLTAWEVGGVRRDGSPPPFSGSKPRWTTWSGLLFFYSLFGKEKKI